MKGCYSVKLKPGAIPFAITSPRRVPIPLLKQTKAELERMVEEKVITPVLKPTEWCAPVAIVPKSDGNVRICVDLIELNKNVMRELHPLPKAEYSLNLLTGAKCFRNWMLILVSGKFLWIKSHPISPHLSPHLVGLDFKDCLLVSPLLQSTSKEGCLKC
ncbi:hypothetical protein AVEN_12772-1 [Araneus ventricosus]|uniref:Transposon Ty3-I Gag-Pol polyprotein n=1 Tax=Araneus ventricosus TaxID=182803 RepID=A0A4Y2ABS5_ARAVE|nr:hypothetical protein AVEN_12772-1 [Araneus ventricosus]